MNKKKELAIVLGATGNMAFALANVLIGIKKYSPKINADFIVFENNITELDKKLLNSIFPIKFIDYKFPLAAEKFDIGTLERFTLLSFSRYECFNMLNEYKNVLWLDIDLLIKGNISTILNYTNSGLSLYLDGGKVEENFTVPIDSYDMKKNYYNAGVMLIDDTLPEYEKITGWCYQKTLELAQYLTFADQGIINIMIQEFKLTVNPLSFKFNCHPGLKKNLKTAIILHSFCSEKFWNFYNFKEWNENYIKWIKRGGTPYTGKKTGVIERFFTERNLPNPLTRPRPFFKRLLERQ